jgi:2-polyprenyl-6-hydroxyphenyl methylase/3-demethylubiquinone-9 3-methyltransferase
VLDRAFLQGLGTFDVVYSWGVLHHTGRMWAALELTTAAVGADGKLFLAIYNDQGGASRRWRAVKRAYNRLPAPGKFLLVLAAGAYLEGKYALIRLVRLQNPLPLKSWTQRKKERGMSVFRDLVDWVGGYPFEVAKPEEVFDFCRKRGFVLERLLTAGGGFACNQYVFRRGEGAPPRRPGDPRDPVRPPAEGG